MVKPKIKVTNGVAWRPVSHGVSPKGVFNLFKARKSNKFLTQQYSIMRLSGQFQTSLFFNEMISRVQKRKPNLIQATKQKQTNKKQQRKQFFAYKNF